MSRPTKEWSAGDELTASDLNTNFDEVWDEKEKERFTCGESIAINEAVYLKASDGKIYKTNAQYNDERTYSFIGFAKEAGSANDSILVQLNGNVSGLSDLLIGADYFLSDTSGEISNYSGTKKKMVGIAVSSTVLFIVARYDDDNPKLSLGDVLSASADTERSKSGDFSYEKIKEIKIKVGGNCRIKFDLKTTGTNGDVVFGKIYKNGGAIGTEQGVGDENWATFSEDFENFAAGDLIQLYRMCSASDRTHYCRNFRIYMSFDASSYFEVTQD